jgi:hypothetical protein
VCRQVLCHRYVIIHDQHAGLRVHSCSQRQKLPAFYNGKSKNG